MVTRSGSSSNNGKSSNSSPEHSEYLSPRGYLTVSALIAALDEHPTKKGVRERLCPICESTLSWKEGPDWEAIYTCHGDPSDQHRSLIRAEVKLRLGLNEAAGKSATKDKPKRATLKRDEALKRKLEAAEDAEFRLEMQIRQWVIDARENGLSWAKVCRQLVQTLRVLELLDHYQLYEADLIEQWRDVFGEYPPSLHRQSTAEDAAKVFVEYSRGVVLFCRRRAEWFAYGFEIEGVWSALTEHDIFAKVQQFLEDQSITHTSSLIRQIIDLARKGLTVAEFISDPDLLSFSNGVFKLSTSEFFRHSPYRPVNWQLPRPYVDIEADWSVIEYWLTASLGGNEEMVRRVYCVLAAILRGIRPPGQHKYLELMGKSGGGKGTLIRLIDRLIGEENVFPLSLSDLGDSGNAFALQGLEDGARVITFADEGRYRGSISRFLSLTGNDKVAINRKNRTIIKHRFTGWVVLASTQPVFESQADDTGIKRRRFPITGWTAVEGMGEIEQEFTEGVLVAFTRHLLSIPLQEIYTTIADKAYEAKDELETDTLLGWFNECVLVQAVHGADDYTTWKEQVGTDRRDAGKLFGNYCAYCDRANLPPRNASNFSKGLRSMVERLNKEMRWQMEFKKQSVSVLVGVRIRTDDDAMQPNPID